MHAYIYKWCILISIWLIIFLDDSSKHVTGVLYERMTSSSKPPGKRKWDDFDEVERCVVDVLVKLFQHAVTQNGTPMVCDGPCCLHHQQQQRVRRYDTRQRHTLDDKPKPLGKLPKDATRLLTTWLYAHTRYPYPSVSEKRCMMHQTGLTLSQVNNWFSNARRRKLRPSSHYTRDKHVTYKRAAFDGTLQNHT